MYKFGSGDNDAAHDVVGYDIGDGSGAKAPDKREHLN